MKRIAGTLVLAILVTLVVVGCATTPIEQLYPERWAVTKVGMTLAEFCAIWPEAKYGVMFNPDPNSDTELWTFVKVGYASQQAEYFYFTDGKLVKWRGSQGGFQ